MINEGIRGEIMRRLARAEAEHDVRILLAIESGSRAWGFASVKIVGESNELLNALFREVLQETWREATA